MDGLAFDCPCCGQRHPDLPAIAYRWPDAYFDVPEARLADINADKDFCVIADEFFFVRAVLAIPIIGKNLPLEWGVWGSLSQANYQRYRDSFDDADQAKIGGMFSYLSNELDGYPNSRHLHCVLSPQNGRKRPILELREEQDHRLVHEWMNGITPHRAIELAVPFLHPQGNS